MVLFPLLQLELGLSGVVMVKGERFRGGMGLEETVCEDEWKRGTRVRVCTYIYVFMCMYVYVWACRCVCTYICMYMCTYVRDYSTDQQPSSSPRDLLRLHRVVLRILQAAFHEFVLQALSLELHFLLLVRLTFMRILRPKNRKKKNV